MLNPLGNTNYQSVRQSNMMVARPAVSQHTMLWICHYLMPPCHARIVSHSGKTIIWTRLIGPKQITSIQRLQHVRHALYMGASIRFAAAALYICARQVYLQLLSVCRSISMLKFRVNSLTYHQSFNEQPHRFAQ